MRRHGFTLIELLVVVGIVALLAAVMAPALMGAKARAYSVECGSNLRQLSLGFSIYQQEQEVFPYGFSDVQLGQVIPPEGYAGSATLDKEGLWWFNYLQSSLDFDLGPGSTVWCPARKLNIKGARGNILCGNYGVNRSICKDAQGVTSCDFTGDPVRSSQVKSPSGTLLISDSGYSLLSWLAAVGTNEPVFENFKRTESFYVPGLALNQTRDELCDNPDAIKGRHPHQTLNVGFADGHNDTHSAEYLMIKPNTVTPDHLPSLWIP